MAQSVYCGRVATSPLCHISIRLRLAEDAASSAVQLVFWGLLVLVSLLLLRLLCWLASFFTLFLFLFPLLILILLHFFLFCPTQPCLPTPFHSVLVSISVLWPFQLYFNPCILSIALRFLTLFFRSYICLIGPLNCVSLPENLPQP